MQWPSKNVFMFEAAHSCVLRHVVRSDSSHSCEVTEKLLHYQAN